MLYSLKNKQGAKGTGRKSVQDKWVEHINGSWKRQSIAGKNVPLIQSRRPVDMSKN